ncbi:MFS transporter, AAHS family, benzoate transport protein [Raineyella antarctica]|uniref:MFS transporter, AAHS family, benzoate transport protein n=1 Tax=Raineyella antarctica TaxID=1577474 RepID=A0A1G6GDN7_9ACTN|nr:MFS transporter [Raineyella antarctica]SDB80118.1 MFS transporter, AAHS family, benzoate transport protein [Raineyella antarctica]
MSQATAAPPLDYESPAMQKKRRSTVAWVVGLAFAGLIFDGYDLVVYGAVLPRLTLGDATHGVLGAAMTPGQAGVVGSYAMIGVMIGALVAGTIGDVVGRRLVVLGALGWFSIGMLVTAWSSTITMFSIWRFITGLGVGALVGITGAIVSEFAPPGKKNLATAFTYTGVPMGSLLSALLALAIMPSIKAPLADQTAAFHTMFMIGALPLVTILPLAIWKMPESVGWLASRGKLDKARQVSERTGVPIPEAVVIRPEVAKSSDTRTGWAGLFTVYLVPAILIGLISASCLLLVYSLNTWLPKIMLPVLGSSGGLALLLVLNAGAIAGTLYGSRFADRYSPQRVVAVGFLVGVLAIGLIGYLASTIQLPSAEQVKAGATADVAGPMVLILLITVALVGVGTSGVQSLIYALAANYYRTNVRAAGVAWTGGFGRLGGVFGPILGGALAVAFGRSLGTIFYVLAGIALVAMILTLILPHPKPEAVSTAVQAAPGPIRTGQAAVGRVTGERLYDNIMVVVDETGNELTRQRVSSFVGLTGKNVHLVYLAPEHVMAGEVGSSVINQGDNDTSVDPHHVAQLQEYVNLVSGSGVSASGQVLTATLFGRGGAIVDLAEQLHADLIILNTEIGGQRAKAHLAEEVAKSNPKMAVLIARSTQD